MSNFTQEIADDKNANPDRTYLVAGSLHGSWVDSSLAWFESAVCLDDIDITAAFFALEPRSQMVAIDVIRTAIRSALHIGGVDVRNTHVFAGATADLYRCWLARDVKGVGRETTA